MGWVSLRFGSVSGELCSGRVHVKFAFGSLSGQRFGSNEVQVSVTYGYHVRVSTGLVRVEFGSGLLRVVYSRLARIRYGSNAIWAEWDSVQCLDQYRIRHKLNWV